MHKRAKEGFMRQLGDNHAKSVTVTKSLLYQTTEGDELIAGLRALLGWTKVSLPEEARTYEVTNQLGGEFGKKCKLEGKGALSRRPGGEVEGTWEEHKNTLASLNNMGGVVMSMEDYEGALDYYQQALRGKGKVLGKTHPSTLSTIMNIAAVYKKSENFTKAEEMYRLALDGREKSLGKEHEETKDCARGLVILLCWDLKSKNKTRAPILSYPIQLGDAGGSVRHFQDKLRNFIT